MSRQFSISEFDITPKSWRGSGFRLIHSAIDPHGVVAWGSDLTVERLSQAYRLGVFPWPHDGELFWFCPPERGVLELRALKINKRTMRKFRNTRVENGGPYSYKRNAAFAQVIRKCAEQPRKGQSGTWITDYMIEAYERFEKAGHVLSIECYRGEKLVGGLYGVLVRDEKGKAKSFSAESVFGVESDVAKFCLIETVNWLQSIGLEWMDIQMVTPLTKSFGGHLESREAFLKRLF